VKRLELSSLIKNLVVSGASKSTWVIALFVILSILGIDLGPALAGLGIVGFVVGFALQDTLANFASGLMIMIYRPFDVGDFVTAGGVTGKVKDLTLVSTVIQTLDNKRIMIPNGKVWGDVINNATAERVRRVDMVFGISYSDDVDEARAVLEDVLSGDDRVLADPPPMVRVESLGDSSVNLFCRPWCRTEDYWDLYWDLTRVVKKRFDSEGITFPFPQRDVHVHSEGAPSS
jgi:small conductance mechanosensitive channel